MVLIAFFIVALGFLYSRQQHNRSPIALEILLQVRTAWIWHGINSFAPFLVYCGKYGFIWQCKGEGKEPTLGNIQMLWLILGGLFCLFAVFSPYQRNFRNLILKSILKKSKASITYPDRYSCGYPAFFFNNKFSDFRPYLVVGTLVFTLIILFSMIRAKWARQAGERCNFPTGAGNGGHISYVGVEVTIQSNMGALLKTPDFGSPMRSSFLLISLFTGEAWWLAGGRELFPFLTWANQPVTCWLSLYQPLLLELSLVSTTGGQWYQQPLPLHCLYCCIDRRYLLRTGKPVKTLITLSLLVAVAMVNRYGN